MQRFIITLLFLFSIFGVAKAQTNNGSHSHQIGILSDIHFSPFTDCPSEKKCILLEKLNQSSIDQWPKLFTQYAGDQLPHNGQPTNYALFHDLLIKIQQQQPQNVLILGDFLAHRFRTQYLKYTHDHNRSHYENFIIKTLQYLTHSIQEALPENSSVYPLIGNNDSYGGKNCAYPDYCVIPNGSFFRAAAHNWKELFKDAANKASFMSTFPHAGYYEIVLPNTRDHIIVLNTVLFSIKAQGLHHDQAAHDQLVWLEQKLKNIAAAKEKTWIIFHIPPEIDTYSTIRNFLGIVTPFWEKDYLQQFLSLIHQYNANITAIFSGHTHMDGFLVLDKSNSNHVIIDTFIPSISPIFGNNPAYKIYDYDANNFEIKDFTTYFLNLKNKNSKAEWEKEYSFSCLLGSA